MVTALKLTIDQLESLDDNNRYELIDGELIVSKAPGIPHQISLGRLFYRLSNFLENNPIGLVPCARFLLDSFFQQRSFSCAQSIQT